MLLRSHRGPLGSRLGGQFRPELLPDAGYHVLRSFRHVRLSFPLCFPRFSAMFRALFLVRFPSFSRSPRVCFPAVFILRIRPSAKCPTQCILSVDVRVEVLVVLFCEGDGVFVLRFVFASTRRGAIDQIRMLANHNHPNHSALPGLPANSTLRVSASNSVIVRAGEAATGG
jgi:hypothetical protein